VTNTDPNDDVLRILRANADATERQERPSAENLAALRAAGAFGLRTPTAHGGAGADAVTLAHTLAGLARACPSTAWIAGTCATGKTMATGMFEDAVLKEYFADPDALGCGSGGPTGRGERTDDGVRVSGRWPNVSGCEDASWAILGLMVEGTYSWALIPVAELSIDRTWQMAGMRGTGSHTLVAENVLVPAGRVVAAAPPRLALRLLFAITVLGPMVGAARGALDEITAMFASDRKPYLTAYTRMGESAGARQWLAEATYRVERAERTMIAVAEASDDPELADADGARWSMALADAGRDCRAALERMLDLHGSSGFKSSNPLQRFWRDVSVGTRHPQLNPYLAVENSGQQLAGA
jgi:alkylation response protein AidB-like acyl-CoA dehydrogenase